MKKIFLAITVVLLLCLVGCGRLNRIESQLDEMQSELDEINQKVDAIPIPTPSPEPTPIPSPSPTPLVYTITTKDIVEYFIASNLPVARYETYDEDTDPNDLFGRPLSYIDKTNFYDSRVGSSEYDGCGMIEIFENAANAETRELYIENLYSSGLIQTQYCIRYENILLRFDNEFKPSYVDEYTAALESLLHDND